MLNKSIKKIINYSIHINEILYAGIIRWVNQMKIIGVNLFEVILKRKTTRTCSWYRYHHRCFYEIKTMEGTRCEGSTRLDNILKSGNASLHHSSPPFPAPRTFFKDANVSSRPQKVLFSKFLSLSLSLPFTIQFRTTKRRLIRSATSSSSRRPFLSTVNLPWISVYFFVFIYFRNSKERRRISQAQGIKVNVYIGRDKNRSRRNF